MLVENLIMVMVEKLDYRFEVRFVPGMSVVFGNMSKVESM